MCVLYAQAVPSGGSNKPGALKKMAGKDDPMQLTEKLQDEILTRTNSTLASLARVALEVLGTLDMVAFAKERRLNPVTLQTVPEVCYL